MAVCPLIVFFDDYIGVRLSSGTKGGRRQADSGTFRPEFIGVDGIKAFGNEYTKVFGGVQQTPAQWPG